MHTLRGNKAIAQDEPASSTPDRQHDKLAWLLPVALEVVAALAGAGWMLLSTKTVHPFRPLNRVSQVSGEAALQVWLFVPVLLLIGLLFATRGGGLARYQNLVSRIAFPALPGLMSGFVSGGIVLALRGTALPLYGVQGDAGTMERWTIALMHGHSSPGYPPLFPRIVVTTAELVTHHNVFTAYKYDEILLTALLGPAAYCAWRFVTGRTWSCVLAILAVAVLASPYKSYEEISLAVLVPSSIAYFRYLRRCAERSYWHVALVGVVCGLVFAENFLLYSGYYYWSALGIGVAAAAVFPWRTGLRQGALLIGCTVALFLAVAGQSLIQLFSDPKDAYFFFGTSVDPAYVAINVTDLPGLLAKSVWPPPGELGGVGVYTALVIIGLGVAVWLGWRRTAVVTTISFFVCAWLMRFYFASRMYGTHLVNLWPRTTLELEYCFVVLAVFAVMLGAARIRQWSAQHELPGAAEPAAPSVAGAAAPQQAVGALVAVLLAGALFAGSAASALVDTYMPANNGSLGELAWVSHHEKPSQLSGVHVKSGGNGQ